MAVTPLTCWSDSACRLLSEWLSPPIEMCTVTTGVTFAAMSAPAAHSCPLVSFAVMFPSVVASWLASDRTCVCDVASASRNCAAPWCRPLGECIGCRAVSRCVCSVTSGSFFVPVSSVLSCIGVIDGSVRPEKLTSSPALPPAPTAMGAVCTVPKQAARCLANAETIISPPEVAPSSS